MNDSVKRVVESALEEVRFCLGSDNERLASMERDVEAVRARIAKHVATIADLEAALA